MYSHLTTKRKNSMLSGWADKGSDWKNTSHVIGNRFVKISNKNVQSSKESLEGYPCFTPTPMVVHPCQFCQPIIFWERILTTRFKTNQCKVRRKFRSFPHQISGLVSVKVRVVWYKLMIVFLLHFQARFACEICTIARSPMFMRKFGIFYFYDHKLVIPLKLVCGLFSRFWSIQQCRFDVSINIHPRVRHVRNFWKLSVQIPLISDPESSSNALS